jgi:rRNA maturation endonuclease Nob1
MKKKKYIIRQVLTHNCQPKSQNIRDQAHAENDMNQLSKTNYDKLRQEMELSCNYDNVHHACITK